MITPEEIVDPNVDEHSVMTYLSQFPKSKLKPGAPLRPKLNPKKARAYGPGTHQHTHTHTTNPKKACAYGPGTHQHTHKCFPLSHTPHKCFPLSHTSLALVISLSPGIEPVGNVVMKKAVFTVETISAGMGEVLVHVEDPAGHREEVYTRAHTHTA